MRSSLQYRPDIDGLRAIAVLGVVFYHVGFGAFAGGFIGVDVFFVISGFLITRLIIDELENTGGFRFAHFYVRRARRLFPALFATLAMSGLFAAFLFSPTDLERFGGSLLHAVLSLSNVFFWSESGYFDADAIKKPLLHTWSLSVEEQFYLFWPALLLLLAKFFRGLGVAIALGVIGLVSLLLNVEVMAGADGVVSSIFPTFASWFSEGRATIFYLTPFRVFEFVIGGVLVWAVRRQPGSGLVCDGLSALGLLLIFIPMLTYNKDTIFPSYNALAPCVGAGLLIYSADKAAIVGRVLRNRVAVWVGLVSYSFYLAHWPIIVFYQYGKLDALSTAEGVVICLVSAAVAAIMFRYVEKPFRRPSKEKQSLTSGGFAAACFALALLTVLPAANIWANKGWPWRFAGLSQVDILELDRLRAEVQDDFSQNVNYATFSSAKTKVLVLGDSHGKDISVSLSRNLAVAEYEVRMITLEEACWRLAAAPEEEWRSNSQCYKHLRELTRSQKAKSADIVAVSNKYNIDDLGGLEPLLALLRGANNHHKNLKVIFFGRTLGVGGNFHAEAIRKLQHGHSWTDVNRLAHEKFYDFYEKMESDSKAIVSQLDNVQYVSRLKATCGELECVFFADKNHVVFWDDSHLSLTGLDLIAGRILEEYPGLFSK